MDCHHLKSCLDTLCKTPYLLTIDNLHKSGKSHLRMLQWWHKISYDKQNAHDLPTLQIGNHVAIQNPTSKIWDIYGVITAIGPFRWYFIKAQSGHVLIRNCKFLHKRSPLSVAAPTRDHSSTPNTAMEPRRSSWVRTAQNRLSQDPAWLFISSVSQPKELGGVV